MDISDYPSTPGASSSRITLDDLDAADHPPPVPMVRALRSRRSRLSTHARRAATLSLTLCFPYITAANALPSPIPPLPTHPPTSAAPWARMARQSTLFIRPSTQILNSTLLADDYKIFAMPDNFVVLRQRFSPGFIVLSYLIAFVGSLCTLELLIRRTSNSGWRNQCLLAAAGICFGSVATFSMHFIFNQALSLYHPEIQNGDPLVLHYAPGYTVLSLVASCLAMTVAFFIMGTNSGNWCCCFSRKRPSQRKERENQKQAEEYKKWKMAHVKKGELLSKGSKGMGALVSAASKVAKWSLVDDPSKWDQSSKSSGSGWRSSLTGRRKVVEAEKNWDAVEMRTGGGMVIGMGITQTMEDEMISKDNTLKEIDFRYGRNAARLEITRRGGSPTTTSPTGLTEDVSERVDTGLVTEQDMAASTASLPAMPPAAVYPSRRGSVLGNPSGHIPDFSHSSTEVFAPGYNFPPRIDSSTANLLVRDSRQNSPNESEASPSWKFNRRGSLEIPPHVPFDYSSRRASLPNVKPVTDGTFSSTLFRIQSLPEAEHDHNSPPLGPYTRSSPSFSNSQGRAKTPSPRQEGSSAVQDDRVTFAAEGEEARSDRAERAKYWERHGWTIKLQKFLGFDGVMKGEVIKIIFTGTLAGGGVAAMHYIGQTSIVGMPYIKYNLAFIVGSVIIACGAVIIALYIMFIMLRPKLKHEFIYKIFVALILAAAVCCMHFCGMMGTTYGWPLNTPITRYDLLSGTNGAIVGIVAALALTACLACGFFFVFEAIQARRERQRRRRVVVAAIMIDEQDRMLVNPTDGLPPMCDIASLSGAGEVAKSSKRSGAESVTTGGSTILGMDLTPGHEAFVNALRLSYYWRNPEYTALNPFIRDGERESQIDPTASGTLFSVNTSIQEIRRGSLGTMNSSNVGGIGQPSKISVNRFLERFVFSAAQLAVRLTGQEDGIQRLGVLYDQILTTGWVKLSNSSYTVSKGQLIILVRRVTAQQERNDLLTRHFIFADASAVAIALQKTLSVPLDHVNPLLKDVQRFCDMTSRVELKPGTLYAGVAVVQATPFDGLRILLEKKNRSQLPMRELCIFTSSTTSRVSYLSAGTDEISGTVEDIGEAITWLEGMNLLSIIGRNVAMATNPTSPRDVGGPIVTQLLRHIERAIVPMLDGMLSQDDMAHIIPRLALHPVLVPLTPHRARGPYSNVKDYIPPYMIVLYANYDAAVNTFTDKWLPFNLFRAQNGCVMAPYVGDADKSTTAASVSASASASALPEGFNSARRPSKVQFDIPFTPPPVPSPALPPHFGTQSSTDIASGSEPSWAGFTFPPRNPNPESNVNVESPYTPPSAQIKTPGHRIREGPQRSSLAKPRDFAYPPTSMSAGGNPLQQQQQPQGDGSPGPRTPTLFMGGERREAPGVAEWDLEWLLVLLRSNLRADA